MSESKSIMINTLPTILQVNVISFAFEVLITLAPKKIWF